MLNSYLRLLALCVLITISSTSAWALVLKGVVTNNTLTPLANVSLKLAGGAVAEQTCLTKNYGAYSFTLSPNTEYKIVVTNADYQTRIVLFNTRNITDDIMNGEYTYNITLNTINESNNVPVTYSRHKTFPEMVNIKKEIAVVVPEVIVEKIDPVKIIEPITTTNPTTKNLTQKDTTTKTINVAVSAIADTTLIERIKSVTRINSGFANSPAELSSYLSSVNDRLESNYKNKIQKQISRNKQLIDESGNPITSLYAIIANYEKTQRNK
ncbi:MAG: hypothetical protein ABL940_06660 [Bacteroidia bacterium]